jgi:DNA-binding CsgD family transcriptional regulator
MTKDDVLFGYRQALFAEAARTNVSQRDRLLMRMWRDGRLEAEIAEALDLSRKAVGSYVRELRDAGEDLPYRRPPRSSVEGAARRRRGHSSGMQADPRGVDF